MKKLQQLLCLLLCLVFCLALLPAAALAEDEDTGAIAFVEDPAGEGTIAPATEPETLPAPGDEPNAGDVAINATNFPDDNFRAFVKQYDTNSNGTLSAAELAAVTTMYCNSKNIANLKGVEHFTALEKLYCYSNELTSLDVSKNTALKCLSCSGNQLTSLDVSKNTALEKLYCYDNQLAFLDLSAVPVLKDAVENGTRDTSDSAYDWYYSSWGTLYVDKTVNIITDATGLGVAINVTNFPDANFREDVKQYDTDSNGYLSTAELAEVTSMDGGSKSIADLTGVEHFTALKRLYCYSNELTSLDLSNNTALTKLTCYDNQLTSLDLSNNTALTELTCYDNQLTELDVSNNTELTYLDCEGNQLTFLDLSAVPALKDAVENGTRDTSNSAYDWYYSSWGTLYVDKTVTIITDPTGLGIAINPANFPDAIFRAFVKRYDTDSNGYLSTAELAAVTSMSCVDQNIADLKGIEHFTALTWLGCYDNQLTSLDLSNNTALTTLRCYNNQLTSLDLSKNTSLTGLYCYNNQLTELDVSNNTELTYLECDGNQLTFLDLRLVPALKDAVENGDRDTSDSRYDRYLSSRGTLYVDKTVILVTGGNPFTDVPAGKYYYLPVLWAYYHDPQITGGISDTEFGPSKTCTREQIVTFLWKAMGAPEPTTTVNPFEDVKSTKYYYKPVLWAVENGITGGVGDGKFGVGQPCTREQAMTFLWKAMGSPEPTTTENPFEDVPSTKYYYKPVLWAVENGITSGVDATHFGVGKSCTRGQIVTFLYKALVG